MNVQSAIEQLETMKFEFILSHGYPDEEIRYTYVGDGHPDPGDVKPLLEVVKQKRDAAVEVLRVRKARLAWLEVWDQWSQDENPDHDAVHASRLATSAIIGKLPFYEDGENDVGAAGWQRWAEQFTKQKIIQKEVMPMRVYEPRPLPWDI